MPNHHEFSRGDNPGGNGGERPSSEFFDPVRDALQLHRAQEHSYSQTEGYRSEDVADSGVGEVASHSGDVRSHAWNALLEAANVAAHDLNSGSNEVPREIASQQDANDGHDVQGSSQQEPSRLNAIRTVVESARKLDGGAIRNLDEESMDALRAGRREYRRGIEKKWVGYSAEEKQILTSANSTYRRWAASGETKEGQQEKSFSLDEKRTVIESARNLDSEGIKDLDEESVNVLRVCHNEHSLGVKNNWVGYSVEARGIVVDGNSAYARWAYATNPDVKQQRLESSNNSKRNGKRLQTFLRTHWGLDLSYRYESQLLTAVQENTDRKNISLNALRRKIEQAEKAKSEGRDYESDGLDE